MSQTPQDPFGAPPGEMWNDVPLFREIQRVLSSSSGPVNWELARQVGIASASWGTEDPAPSEDDRRGFEEAVRVAELQVAGFTGLQPPSDVARVEAVRRGQWVAANVDCLRTLLEPGAARVAEAITTRIVAPAPASRTSVMAICPATKTPDQRRSLRPVAPRPARDAGRQRRSRRVGRSAGRA